MDRRYLFIPYLVIPVALAIMIFDQFAQDGHWASVLPRNLDDDPRFQMVFVYPHIILSLLLFLIPENARANGAAVLKTLALYTAPIALAAALLDTDALMMIFLVLTIKHVFGQQAGLLSFQADQQSAPFRWWKGLNTAGLALLYFAYGDGARSLQDSWPGIVPLSAALSAVASLLLLRIPLIHQADAQRRFVISCPQTALGLAANQLICLCAFLGFHFGYASLGVLAPRVIHDVTALCLYTVYVHNRFQSPHLALTTAGAVLAVFGVGTFLSPLCAEWFFTLGIAVSLAHYAVEAGMWKKSSPARKHLQFS